MPTDCITHCKILIGNKTLNQQQLQTICQTFQLGKLLGDPVVIETNRLWHITTERGEFVVKQWQDHKKPAHIEQGEQIAECLAKVGIPVVTAISKFLNLGDVKFAVYPWCEGAVISPQEVSVPNAQLMGALLARIHNINLQLPNIKLAIWQNFQMPNWQVLIAQADQKKLAWVSALTEAFPALQNWSEQYIQASAALNLSPVISHGDIRPANVVWVDATNPWIIDWECAGYIIPAIELFGLALNWGGIEAGELNLETFMATLQGYQSKIKQPCVIDEKIMHASLGSWLAWLEFTMRMSIAGEITAIAETINALKVLQNFVNMLPKIMHWIK